MSDDLPSTGPAPAPEAQRDLPFVANPSQAADDSFVDDLTAAIRLKAHLIGQGVEVDDATLLALARLETDFATDLLEHRNRWARQLDLPVQPDGKGPRRAPAGG